MIAAVAACAAQGVKFILKLGNAIDHSVSRSSGQIAEPSWLAQ